MSRINSCFFWIFQRRNLLRARPALTEPAEPIYELEITGETDAQRKNREVRNQEKRVGWENHVIKAKEKGVLGRTIVLVRVNDRSTKIFLLQLESSLLKGIILSVEKRKRMRV